MKFFCFRVPDDRKHTLLPRSDLREAVEFSFLIPRNSWFWLELLDWDPEDCEQDGSEPGE